MCSYFRHYYPMEFITSFLNNAANDDDIQNGAILARQRGIKITQPKFGVSKSEYFFDKERKVIAKGLASVKYLSQTVANELYNLSQSKQYTSFSDLLFDIIHLTSVDSRQLDCLIKIDFFSDFGNQRELFAVVDLFDTFKKGEAKQIKKATIEGSPLEEIVKRHASSKTKSGAEAKSYTLTDVRAILVEGEQHIKSVNAPDISILVKARNFKDIMGYAGYVSGRENDRNKLYITKVFPVRRKKDGVVFGYSVFTQSIGSGKESRMTVIKSRFDKDPIKEDDIIVCKRWERDGKYFRMLDYEHFVI